MSVGQPKASPAAGAPGGEGAHLSRGRLIILSAPSGAGKSTVCAILRHRLPDLRYSVSYTTRAPRPGEIDGKDYFFVDEAAFEDGIGAGRWAEWARVHGHYYGTASDCIDRMLSQGHDLLLDIDVQGAAQLVAQYPRAVTIFIMPPSMAVLRQRLEKRGTDNPEVIARRMRTAEDEMAASSRYRHIVVNDRLERTVGDLMAILVPGE